jgi:hypothetical protein
LVRWCMRPPRVPRGQSSKSLSVILAHGGPDAVKASRLLDGAPVGFAGYRDGEAVRNVAPRTVTRKQLAGAARAALGGGRRLEGVERVAGGSKKGVYRLVMDDATTAIAYLWDDAENFWPAAEGDDDLTDPFSPGLGLDLFQAAHARLDGLGVRVPAIRLLDRDGAYCHADLAIVEDLPVGEP